MSKNVKIKFSTSIDVQYENVSIKILCSRTFGVSWNNLVYKCLILILTWAIWKWSCSLQVVGFDDLDIFSLQSSIQSLCLVTCPLLSNLAPAQSLIEVWPATRVWFLQGVETLWPFCNALSPSVVWRAHFYIGVLSISSFSKLTSGNQAIVIGSGAQTQPHLRALRMGRDYSWCIASELSTGTHIFLHCRITEKM